MKAKRFEAAIDVLLQMSLPSKGRAWVYTVISQRATRLAEIVHAEPEGSEERERLSQKLQRVCERYEVELQPPTEGAGASVADPTDAAPA